MALYRPIDIESGRLLYDGMTSRFIGDASSTGHEGPVTGEKSQGRRLSEQIVEHVIQLISTGDYVGGEKLPSERELADSLGISRPLVREGYRTLEALGVVEVRHGVGALVAKHSHKTLGVVRYLWDHAAEAMEVLEVRSVLAARCGELAAERISDLKLTALERTLEAQKEALTRGDPEELVRIDREFHDQIYHATHNRVLFAMEEYTREILGDHRILTLISRPEDSFAEHGLILAALRDRDPSAARSAMRLHTLRSNALIQNSLDSRTIETNAVLCEVKERAGG